MTVKPIGVIALNTFRENLRDKILYNLLLFALLLIGASMVLGELTIAEKKKMVFDIGLAAINLMGVIIAVFVGIGLVSKEIERRTVYTIMARPIARAHFILGKYCGLALTLLVNIAIMLLVYLVTLWVNHVPMHVGVIQAIGLIYVELLLVTAIALFFSTFSSATLSAMMTLGLYVVGHLTTDLKAIGEKSLQPAVKTLTTALYYLCPNLEALNLKGEAAAGLAMGVSYLSLAAAYGLLYAVLLVGGACLVFQRRDF